MLMMSAATAVTVAGGRAAAARAKPYSTRFKVRRPFVAVSALRNNKETAIDEFTAQQNLLDLRRRKALEIASREKPALGGATYRPEQPRLSSAVAEMQPSRPDTSASARPSRMQPEGLQNKAVIDEFTAQQNLLELRRRKAEEIASREKPAPGGATYRPERSSRAAAADVVTSRSTVSIKRPAAGRKPSDGRSAARPTSSARSQGRPTTGAPGGAKNPLRLLGKILTGKK